MAAVLFRFFSNFCVVSPRCSGFEYVASPRLSGFSSLCVGPYPPLFFQSLHRPLLCVHPSHAPLSPYALLQSRSSSEVQFLNFGLHSEILLSAKFAGCQIWAGGKNRASLSDEFPRTVSKRFSKLFLSEISPTLPFKMAASTQSVHIC